LFGKIPYRSLSVGASKGFILCEEMNNATAMLKIKMDEGSVCAVSLARSEKPSAK